MKATPCRFAAAALLALAVLAGAAADIPTAGGPLQWPPPPDAPRLRYLSSIDGRSARAEPGKLLSFFRFLVGLTPRLQAAQDRHLINPNAVFVRDGQIFISDPGSRSVLRYDEADGKTEWLPSGRALKLVSPIGVAAAPDGRIFVADSGLGKVLILDKSGRPAGEFRGDPLGLGKPASLALAPDRVFVSDTRFHRISAYGLDGGYLYSFGARGRGPGEFNFPTYLFYSTTTARLWVCDSGNFRVQSLDPTGRPLGAFGHSGDRPGFLARPRGLALDSEGHIHMTDGAFEALQVFDDAGRLLLFVGSAGEAPGAFNLPGGVFADSRDRIFVADTFNGRVQVFQYLKEQAP